MEKMRCKKDCKTCKIYLNVFRGKGKICPIVYENFYWRKGKKILLGV